MKTDIIRIEGYGVTICSPEHIYNPRDIIYTVYIRYLGDNKHVPNINSSYILFKVYHVRPYIPSANGKLYHTTIVYGHSLYYKEVYHLDMIR